MDTIVVCFSCGDIEILGYFQLSDLKCDDRNADTLLKQPCSFT